jgi:HK97 family phage major capsid protein
VVPSRDVTDAAVTSNVSSFSGNSDWPIQSLEQSPAGAHLDWVVMTDATASYNLHLEQAILGGSGTGTSLLGLLNSLPSTYTNNPTVTYTAATPLATGLIPYLGGVLAAVNRNRGLNGEYWQLPGAFVGWLASSEDQQNRPLAFANTDGAGHFDLLTIPVAINNAITPTYSSAGNLAGGEQRAIMTRPSDYLLLESDPVLDIMEDVLSGTLEVRIQYRRSAAFLNRYPSGTAVLVGTGMIPASTPVAY